MALPSTLPAFQSDKVNDVLVFTHSNHRARFADNVFKGNAFQAHMLLAGRINQDGGASLLYEIEVVDDAAGADTVDTSSDVDIAPEWNQIALAARYEYAQLVGSIVIRDYEKALNMGDNEVLNLVENRFLNAEKEMSQKLELMITKSGAATKATDFHGLGVIVKNGGALGGLTGGTNAGQVDVWRSPAVTNRAVATGADSDPALAIDGGKGREYISKLVRSVSRGGVERPDLVLTNADTFARIESIAWDKARYQVGTVGRSEALYQLKFDNFIFDHAIVLWTDSATLVPAASVTNPIYVLNTSALELVCHSEMWMDLKGPIRDRDKVSDAFQIQALGQLCCDNRSLQTVSWQTKA